MRVDRFSNPHRRWNKRWALLLAAAALPAVAAGAQILSVYPPEGADLTDPIALLARKIESGEVHLEFEGPRGYLDAVLDELDIPVESQMLVYSKTSLQSNLITPETPRALYFNDDVYIGWVQNGLIEAASTDPRYGTIFYTLEQSPDGPPLFRREGARCINCHLPSRMEVPIARLMVMSVMPNAEGTPLGLTVELTTDQSPMGSRWGGWYVTGATSEGTRMGNSIFGSDLGPEWDVRSPRQLSSVGERFNVSPYLTDRSDVAALLVLTHQAQIHNLIGEVAYSVSHLSEDLRRGDPERVDRRVAELVEPLVRALFFVDATPLESPVDDSPFARRFAAAGPHDEGGRSLRELDLQDRLLRYPLSYLVYSKSFEELPSEALEQIYRRFAEVLDPEDSSAEFSHLTPDDRVAIREILLDTSPSFRSWIETQPPGSAPVAP